MHILEECFKVIDEDDSGDIDFEEFLKVSRGIH